MIRFVNAKINIGLQIVNRREDGYHDLQTLFYPIGKLAGTPANPCAFCDILELTADSSLRGIEFECDAPYPNETNLAYRAAASYMEAAGIPAGLRIRLEKHIPDGAGIGGGSADAAFTLRMINELSGNTLPEAELHRIALHLGADCPYFLLNRPAYAEGVGERLTECALSLAGYRLLLVRPHVRVSTREAFAGVTPKPAEYHLPDLATLPIEEWQQVAHNDFEDSLFPRHPELAAIKEGLLQSGALYASLTGSGSCLYGIYRTDQAATAAKERIEKMHAVEKCYLLLLD